MDVDLSTLSLDVNRPRSPLEGSHRALDGIGDFVAAADLRPLCLVGKRFRSDSRVPAAVQRALTTAAGALRILKSCSKSLVMDLAFVLEGQTPEALPEKILGTVEWNHFDLDPDNSPVIKVCGEDN